MKSSFHTHRDKLNDDYYWATSKLKEAFTNEITNCDSEWEVIEKIAADSALPPKVALCAYVNLLSKKAPDETRLTVLFVNKQSRSEPGFTGTLTLRLHFVEERPPKYRFVPSKEMLCIENTEFLSVFDTALEAVLALDPKSELDCDNYVIEWKIDIHETKKDISDLTGKSLGAGIAVGLLNLLKGSFSKTHQCYSYFDDIGVLFKRNKLWGITGEVTAEGDFYWPANVGKKTWAEQCPHTVFVGAGLPIRDGGLKGEVIPILSLKEFVHRFVRDDAMPKTVHRKSLLIPIVISVIVLVILCFGGYKGYKHFNPDVRDIQEIARIGELRLPEGCKQIFELPNLFSQAEWDHTIYPALVQQQHPFALVIGNPDEWVDQTSPVSLDNLYKLQNLHTLTIHHSNVTSIPHLEKMIYLERLCLLGSSIENIENCTKLQNLRTLVLDSGFIRKYPSEYAFPNLKDMILHVDESTKDIDLTKCTSLKRLAIHGNAIENIRGLSKLDLQDVILFTPNLLPNVTFGNLSDDDQDEISRIDLENENRTRLPRGIKKLVICDTRFINNIDITQFENLELIELSNCSLESLTMNSVSSNLKHLSILSCEKLKSLSCDGLSSLEYLTVKECGTNTIEKLDQCSKLLLLDLQGSPINEISNIKKLRNLSRIDLSNTKISKIPVIHHNNLCIIFITQTALADKLGKGGQIWRIPDNPNFFLDTGGIWFKITPETHSLSDVEPGELDILISKKNKHFVSNGELETDSWKSFNYRGSIAKVVWLPPGFHEAKWFSLNGWLRPDQIREKTHINPGGISEDWGIAKDVCLRDDYQSDMFFTESSSNDNLRSSFYSSKNPYTNKESGDEEGMYGGYSAGIRKDLRIDSSKMPKWVLEIMQN